MGRQWTQTEEEGYIKVRDQTFIHQLLPGVQNFALKDWMIKKSVNRVAILAAIAVHAFGSHAAAESNQDTMTLTAEGVRSDLRKCLARPEVYRPRIAEDSLGLKISEYRKTPDLAAARVLSRLLNRHLASTLWLHASRRGQDAPGYNAVLIDAEDSIVANVKVSSFWSDADLDQFVEKKLSKMIRYGRLEEWDRYLMNFVRTLGGLPRDSRADSVEILAKRFGHYRYLLKNTCDLARFFAPGTDREAWLVLDAFELKTMGDRVRNRIASLSIRKNPLLTIMIIQLNQVTTFRNGATHVTALEPCDTALSKADLTRIDFPDMGVDTKRDELPRPRGEPLIRVAP